MRNKQYGLYIILALFLFVSLVGAEEINVLNMSNEADLQIYEITTVHFDSTYNEWHILSRNRSISLNFTSSYMFHVWDFNAEIDGDPYLFVPRPSVADIGPKNNKTFYFKYELPINGTRLVKLSFWMSNVKRKTNDIPLPLINWSIHIYPFDEYYIFSQNRTIQNGESRMVYFEFPDVDIKINALCIGEHQMEVKCGKKSTPMEIKVNEKVINLKNKLLTTEVSIIDNKLVGFNWTIFQVAPGYSKKIDCSFEGPFAKENRNISFSRSFYPSQLLFYILASITIFVTIYHIRKTKGVIERLYRIYVIVLVPLILIEFTVSIIPPSRPLSFTLLDSIVVWPLIILLPVTLIELFKRIKFRKEETEDW